MYLTIADGIKSFASVRSRATEVDFDNCGATIYIASLEDIIASKKAVGRPKDLAVIEELELTLDEQKKIRKTSLWRMCMKLHYGQEFVPCSVCR